jgi:tetratricopeptide (TPR) repeat protein
MKLCARISAAAALLVILGSTVGCAKLQARDQLVKGVQSFKSGQYEQATGHFEKSIELDPNYDVAKLYLATAYSYQVVPNLDSADNLKIAHKALSGFDEVLSHNPNDMGALRQEASIYRNIKQFDKAKEIEMKVLQLAPNDAEAAYTIGVIDWTEAYKNATSALAAAGMQDDGAGNVKMSKDVCAKIKTLNTPLVDEAQKYLQQAIDLRTNYDDAMSYMNLNYRRRADLDCGNDAARKADLAQADAWVQKSIGARKANEAKKEEAASHGGITAQ